MSIISHEINSGNYIYRSGDKSDKIYFITSGKILIIKKKSQQKLILFDLRESDVFGDFEFFKSNVRSTSAYAETDAEYLEIDPEDLKCSNENHSNNLILSIIKSLSIRMNSFCSELLSRGENQRVFQEATKISFNRITIEAISKKAMKSVNGIKLIEIKELPFTIGRYSRKKVNRLFYRNDLELIDKEPHIVSRHHCSLVLIEDLLFVKDLKSKLGTIVNNEKLKSKHNFLLAPLKQGENIIYFGSKSDNLIFKIIIK
ncbi:MAG: cyclic nucleotide-binding domain-containing protein [Candidatus Cloacimonetes bacterium]|nr:cyclic nucleotide-binding domain-containing protein [Candidatus Cloacimonadota bacterium]